jgi:hypothetical protein
MVHIVIESLLAGIAVVGWYYAIRFALALRDALLDLAKLLERIPAPNGDEVTKRDILVRIDEQLIRMGARKRGEWRRSA